MGSVVTTIVAAATVLLTDPLAIFRNLKGLYTLLYIKACKRRVKSRFDLYDMETNNDPTKVGYLSPPVEFVMESPLPEAELIHRADEVFFYGTNSQSQSMIVRIALSSNNQSEAWIHLDLKDGKTYTLKESSGFQQSCSDGNAFTCGGLQVKYMAPMRRWRIFFNGLLWELDKESGTEKKVHVKFSIIWRASSDPFDVLSDIDPNPLATAMAKASWKQTTPPLQKLNDGMDFYSQSGVLTGPVTIEGRDEERIIYLYGERMRFTGDTHIANGMEFYHIMGITSKNGRFVHLVEASIDNVVENLTFGYLINPNAHMTTTTDSEIQLEATKAKDSKVYAKFHDEDHTYELRSTDIGDETPYKSNTGWNGRLSISHFNFTLNGIPGNGFVIKGKILKSPKRSIQAQEPSVTVVPLVARFSEKICQDSEVSGGKGSSLAKLTELSQEFQNFVVPGGIVVGTAAYEMFLTKEVLNKIRDLENVLYGNTPGNVKSACQSVMDEITQSDIPDKVVKAISDNLRKEFPDGKVEYKFAVRSSATGEDTEQMSAAGQMETFLGISGMNEILQAVKKCWASQFGYVAVQYKRQYGQIINSPMAVVIQKMIPCDVAGVLFTCDPLTGNPASMSITGNYGLGESVVSGSEEPDTIEIDRRDDDNLFVKNSTIGSKNRRIIVNEQGGTSLEDISEHERQSCCLTDEMALRLANIAIKIERSYRSHRDIEWGFWNNNLYIFQSRPVTSGSGENDYELVHENDSAMRIENESLTVCNVGEVMPGALTPLGGEVMLKFFNIVFQRKTITDWQPDRRNAYYSMGMVTMYQHCMFFTIDFFHRIKAGLEYIQAGCISMFGRPLEDPDLIQAAWDRHGENKLKNSVSMKINLLKRMLYGARLRLKRGLKLYENYRIPVEQYKTSRQLFDTLMYRCTDIVEAMNCHMVCSEGSSVWNIVIFETLRKAAGGLNADVYNAFSRLLTTTSVVESADVPMAMEKLAVTISGEVSHDEFKKMETEDALRWLETSETPSGKEYREFIKKHGHRCLKEFDVHTPTWTTNPAPLIKLLQNLVGNVTKKDKVIKAKENIDALLSELNIPVGYKIKLLLKIILPFSRRAVVNREASKSLLIKCIDAWRHGYHRLAQLMVSEGRIPDPELLFFMSLAEIDELLRSRTPKIIARAVHRKRLYPEMDKYIFPEISTGFPVPINKETAPIVVNEDNFSMKGIPVSQGVRKGFVRVALDLEEASYLKPGEILLTYSTDIGWSPYFPILAGVVTELGGLISHGAVVSREYGIPCIAGLHGATRQFQTGDYVLLDGNKGILQKLAKPDLPTDA